MTKTSTRDRIVRAAAGVGVTLTLLGADPADHDPGLSEAAREAVLAAVTTDGRSSRKTVAAGSPPAPSRSRPSFPRRRPS
ncbi:MAG: hypothetical protein AVDCRST_MAG01-01-3911 [uncultured Rubrobacteraceae bacterium]|uniref:Uncharacterized protein n=1 Tax=uncultured Rubrobacteraceae bacterium TaxID=349277 RepID=A0A6J4QGY7_9ACTN|nr:MAG: hypothetical protein AVDCRST_MAG01-01-3911 [uncultured Rubrobacteraceae bacterium]